MKLIDELKAESNLYKKWACDLNLALGILKKNNYDSPSKEYAEEVHANYLKEVNQYLKADNKKHFTEDHLH